MRGSPATHLFGIEKAPVVQQKEVEKKGKRPFRHAESKTKYVEGKSAIMNRFRAVIERHRGSRDPSRRTLKKTAQREFRFVGIPSCNLKT